MEWIRTCSRKFTPFVDMPQQAMMETVFCLIGFSGDDANFPHSSGRVRDDMGRSARKSIRWGSRVPMLKRAPDPGSCPVLAQAAGRPWGRRAPGGGGAGCSSFARTPCHGRVCISHDTAQGHSTLTDSRPDVDAHRPSWERRAWERLCPFRKWDSRTAADRCGRDTRAPRTSVSARSDSTEPASARANRFRSVKRSCDAAPRRVRQAGRPRRSREPEAAGRSRRRRLARRPSVADGGHEANGLDPHPGSASMR